MRFSPVSGVSLIPDTVCKSWSCWQILSRMRADLRENPTNQWPSRDALIQTAGSISNSARYHSDANIALGPNLKMYIPGQIRISNALQSDGYYTGNAPPSGNNAIYSMVVIYPIRTAFMHLAWNGNNLRQTCLYMPIHHMNLNFLGRCFAEERLKMYVTCLIYFAMSTQCSAVDHNLSRKNVK